MYLLTNPINVLKDALDLNYVLHDRPLYVRDNSPDYLQLIITIKFLHPFVLEVLTVTPDKNRAGPIRLNNKLGLYESIKNHVRSKKNEKLHFEGMEKKLYA